jgi:cellulose synthase/poly-beta-1,6-N-acetylglucosamine synthase-like glycosyltransferase
MTKLVTLALPVYKRFDYLASVLNMVASQDYPKIDLLVSDNGLNGTAVPEFVNRHYPKPYRFRQNTATVGISAHFNQLLHDAAGEYVVILGDDDEISPNYVSDLVSALERHPEASIAFSIQEAIDAEGHLIKRSSDTVPEIISGRDFIRAAWGTHQYGFTSFSTFLGKTKALLAVGGFPIFWVAQGDEDTLIVKTCIDNFVVFSTRSVFRKRYHDGSDQHLMAIHDLARGLRDFLRNLNTDPHILAYASAHPAEWAESKAYLVDNIWKTYYDRWRDVYRQRMARSDWVMAAFKLPPIPRYYKAVAYTLVYSTLAQGKRLFTQAYEACRPARNPSLK